MSTYKNLISLGAAAVFALGLAACSSSGDGPPPVDSTEFVGKYILSGGTISGLDADDTTVTVAKDETLELPDNLGSVTCVSDGGCTGTVSDGTLTITGNIRIDSIGSGFSHAVAAAVKKSSLFVAALPKPTPPPVAAPAACTDAACVKHYKDAMDAAKTVLDAAKADQNSTQAQIAAAQKAYDDAKKAYNDADAAQKAYAAMQPPMYDTADALKAMDDAIKSPTTLPTTTPAFVANGGTSAVMGGKVTVPVSSTDDTNTFSQATWPVGKITGWAGSVWEKSADGDSVVVYTDKQADKGAKWSVFYAGNASNNNDNAKLGTEEGFIWATRDGVVGGVNSDGVITFTEANLDADATKLISASMIPSEKGKSTTYPDNDKDSTNDFEVEFAGTFHGVAGKYKCVSSTACAAGTNLQGVLSLTGEWIFTPTSTDSMVADVRSDADYMDFGYWVRTDDSGDTVDYDVNSFARGQDTSVVSAAVKSATYKGGAAGLYSKRAFASDGKGAVEAAGRFTADAELMANFGGDDVAPNARFTITGTIKNFMDGGGNVIDAAWSLELMSAKITESSGAIGADSDTTTKHTAKTTGGGDWTGQFYGADADATTYPTGVAGKFDGEFNNGRVIGAFGATHSK